jgi:ribonuclease-3
MQAEAESRANALASRLGLVLAQPALLKQALTHRSFGVPNNERLEFIGDAMLNLAVAAITFRRYPDMDEGALSRLRANLVNQAVLAQIAEEYSLGTELRLGEGEIKTGGAARPSILADAVESLIGAVYLDAGHDAAFKFVERLFTSRIDNPVDANAQKDAKTVLQEWLQARKHALPQYMVKRIEGAQHAQTFFVECITERPAFKVEGSGVSRRAAEQMAAARVMEKIIAKGLT